jgi:GxxExxY protein
MMMNSNLLHSDITSLVIKAFFNVYNTLGFGFLEKVYQNSLLLELKSLGLDCAAGVPIDVYYHNYRVGHYIADIIVNDVVIIEIKAADCLLNEHEAQIINYLKATNIEVGMLLNFGKTAQFKRRVFSKAFKPTNITHSSP